jgi:hypothetical protein
VSASYRVPYWWLFGGTFEVLLVGFIVLSIWIGSWGLLVFWLLFGAFTFDRFEYRTLYRLDLVDDLLVGRSVVRRWTIPTADVTKITPGWRRAWWRRNRNVYFMTRTRGRPLYIWCGKGLFEFLTAIGSVQPELSPRPEDGQSRVERSKGKSGFTVHQTV